jgi:plastocyanin
MKIKAAIVIIFIIVLISGCIKDIQDTQDNKIIEPNGTREIRIETKGVDTDINTSNEESVHSLLKEDIENQLTENKEDMFEYTITAHMTYFNYSQNEIDPLGDYLYEENYTSKGDGAVDDFYMWDGKAENFYKIILNDLHETFGAYVFREVDISLIRDDRFRTYEFEYIILPSGYQDNGTVFKYKGEMDIALIERRDPIINHIRIEALIFITSPQEGKIIHVGDKPQETSSEDKVRILVGDTVEWRNMETAKNPRYLISEDGLWSEPIRINYAKTHEYTFNETGTYTFSLMYNEFNSRQKIVVI